MEVDHVALVTRLGETVRRAAEARAHLNEDFPVGAKHRATWRDARTELADSVPALLDYIADLQAAKVQEMSDEQVVALMGGHDAAEEAEAHARYVMNVAFREDAFVRGFREIQLLATQGLEETGAVEGDLEHTLFVSIHRIACEHMRRKSLDDLVRAGEAMGAYSDGDDLSRAKPGQDEPHG